jgi:F-type H+-transporting ATPase subunit delta
MREQDIPVLETYVEALLAAAGDAANKDALYLEAQDLLQVIRKNRSLPRFLERPAFLKEDKKQMIMRVFKGKLSPLMFHLPLLLIDKNRAELWEEILSLFVRKVEEEKGIRSAIITSAHEIPTEQKLKLQVTLEKYTDSKLRIQYRLNKDLIGGIVFRSGDRMIDSSIQTHLRAVRSRLFHLPLEKGVA